MPPSFALLFFFFIYTATPEIYTLSLHDALPICTGQTSRHCAGSPTSRGASKAFRYSSDRKSTRLNSSHTSISYADFCLKKKNGKLLLLKTKVNWCDPDNNKNLLNTK